MNAYEAFEAMDREEQAKPSDVVAKPGPLQVEPVVEAGRAETSSLLTCFADIPQKVVPWLWHGWLVEGGLHILAGAGSTGKTTIALSFAATISTGGRWPDTSRCEVPGNVLIWSSEDDPSFTIGPRLVAAGADLSRCHFVGGVGLDRMPFDPATDLGKLEDEIRRIGGAKFLLIDPIVSVVQGEGNSNPQVRRSLQPLVDLGQKFGCAILGISHFNKGSKDNAPVDRVNGSLAYTALARVVMGTVRRNPEEMAEGDLPCKFVRTKGNLAADSDSGGFEYGPEEVEIQTDALRASRTKWGKGVAGTAAEILREAESTGEAQGGRVAATEAKDWLQSLLAYGPMKFSEVKSKGNSEGYSDKVLRTARECLGLVVARTGCGKTMASWWGLPGSTVPDEC
ncbi:MAG TPA: AAA family ATPase [Fibrobacteria bacterium]|mgnify:CR=1 FL=1|nr:AAA family ATPase [Fibrobacteria bacterium]